MSLYHPYIGCHRELYVLNTKGDSMHRAHAIQVKDMVLDPPLSATMQNVAGQLASTSRKTYTSDAKHFAQWMAERNLSFSSLGRDDLVAYLAHLAKTYTKATASRMWAVARRLLMA